MKQNILETLVGFIVIIVAVFFFTFAYKIGHYSKLTDGYTLKARFQNVEGIINGSDVMLSGIKIGSVTNMTLDENNYFAILTIKIDNKIKLPKDSNLAIVTSGLLGGKYIAISPGMADEHLAPGDQINDTRAAINIESIISKLIYSFIQKK